MNTFTNNDSPVSRLFRTGLALVVAGGLAVAACSDDSNDDMSDSAPSTTDTAEADASGPPAAASADELILDYTLYVEGGIQVSGIGVSPDRMSIALVTDRERMIVYDLEELAVSAEFSVQLGDLPRQGSTEAVKFTSDNEVAVFYPDAGVVRRYDLSGEMVDEVDVKGSGSDFADAMSVTDEGSLLLATDNGSLVQVDANGGTGTEVRLALDGELGEIVGLSNAGDGSAYVATDDGQVLHVELATGEVEELPTTSEVTEPSDIEYFVNPEDEPVIAITDDADQYNDTEGPIRLFLVP
jgi:outer membrane protein assembly factor BamB